MEGVTDILFQLDHCKFCIGNEDEKFSDLIIIWHEGKFMDQSGTYSYILTDMVNNRL